MSKDWLALYEGSDFYETDIVSGEKFIVSIYWFWLTDEESDTPARCAQISCWLSESEMDELMSDMEEYDAWQSGQKLYIEDLTIEEANRRIEEAVNACKSFW